MKALRSAAWLVSFFILAPIGLGAKDAIPAGTILPVRLNSTLSSAKSKPNQAVTARVMQEVPLPNGAVIRAGTKMMGHIVSVTSASKQSRGSLTLRFDTLEMEERRISVSTGLRAIASFLAVQGAQVPRMGADPGTPESAWTTIQIGGDVVFRGGGYVEERRERVGRPVPGGVLSRLQSNPDRGCSGPSDSSEARQALWLFSSDACGAYDLPHLQIRPADPSHPSGEITLDSAKGQVNVRAGAGMLLAVIPPGPGT